jgi:putative copper resistance protein D
LTDLLIWVRAIHFAATISVVGAVFFAAFVAEPAFRRADHEGDIAALVHPRLTWIKSISLLVVVISGTCWLVLLARQLSGLPITAVISEGPLWTVLSQTDFGQVWAARFVLAVLLGGALFLPANTPWPHSPWRALVVGLLAAALVGTLAWAGHAAANADSDSKGMVHLVADILHLVAAAAWVGALVPLALLLGVVSNHQHGRSISIARLATSRFSTLGVISVGTLLATGIVNSWVLAGSVHALTATDYGHLLLLKVALFLVMLSVAAVNRLRLTPSLLREGDTASARDAALQLRRNAMIEAAVGAIILIIVALLGTLPPGLEGEAMELINLFG